MDIHSIRGLVVCTCKLHIWSIQIIELMSTIMDDPCIRSIGAVWHCFFALILCFFKKDIMKICLIRLMSKKCFEKPVCFRTEKKIFLLLFLFQKFMFQKNMFLKEKIPNGPITDRTKHPIFFFFTNEGQQPS